MPTKISSKQMVRRMNSPIVSPVLALNTRRKSTRDLYPQKSGRDFMSLRGLARSILTRLSRSSCMLSNIDCLWDCLNSCVARRREHPISFATSSRPIRSQAWRRMNSMAFRTRLSPHMHEDSRLVTQAMPYSNFCGFVFGFDISLSSNAHAEYPPFS